MFSINQRANEDDSQSNPHPEAGLLTSGREDRHDMATGVQRERERECGWLRQVDITPQGKKPWHAKIN